jgi:hypothetical protein
MTSAALINTLMTRVPTGAAARRAPRQVLRPWLEL